MLLNLKFIYFEGYLRKYFLAYAYLKAQKKSCLQTARKFCYECYYSVYSYFIMVAFQYLVKKRNVSTIS